MPKVSSSSGSSDVRDPDDPFEIDRSEDDGLRVNTNDPIEYAKAVAADVARAKIQLKLSY